MELILIITSGILAILYGLELLKNIKLEKERDIETFEKNKLERENKKLKSDEYRSYLIQKLIDKNKQISLLNSKVQYKDKIINKLKGDGKIICNFKEYEGEIKI